MDAPIQVHRKAGTGYIHKGYKCRKIAGKVLREHREVMERILGRSLLAHETVHHKNGQRLDNSEDNLELWSISQPPGQRAQDKAAWAVAFLESYGFLVRAPLENPFGEE